MEGGSEQFDARFANFSSKPGDKGFGLVLYRGAKLDGGKEKSKSGLAVNVPDVDHPKRDGNTPPCPHSILL